MSALAAAPRRASLWKVALLAFAAMVVQDVLGTAMVIFEAHFNPAASAVCDALGWFAGLICSALALESIIHDGWRTRRSLVIIAAVSAANIAGTYSGVTIGSLLTHH